MQVVRWSPRRYVPTASNELERAFDTMLKNWASPVSEFDWNPSIDVSESDKDFVVKADIPGVDPKDVDISIDNNSLVISGEKRQEEEEKGRNYYRLERSYGTFRRTFVLPSDAEVDKVKASSKDGVVTITIPKSAVSASKKVEIETS
jgi:HSP20 family protein